MQDLGRLVLIAGLGLVILGGVMIVLGRFFPFFGRLPGDIRIQTENFTCFVPFVSMIVISIILTILANIILRLLR